MVLMGRSVLAVALIVVAVAASCSTTQLSTPAPSGRALTTAELKIRLIDQFGPLWYCDPDLYPVARADEAAVAKQNFSQAQADTDGFAAVTDHLGISGTTFTDAQKLAIYQLWKQVRAISLDPAQAGSYRFDYLNMPPPGASAGRRSTGTIDGRGAVTIEQQVPATRPNCPICLARGTRIATPDGEVSVEDVRVGMHVWSIDATGRRFVAIVARIGRTPVPPTHEVVRLVLDDGRVLQASPGHPLADGRLLGTLMAGDSVDGATVMSATLEPYDGGFTYDLLPDGPTGTYFADGIPLSSTLAPPPS
jgi:Hint domain